MIETQQFVHYRDFSQKYKFVTALSVALQVVLQNCIGVVKRPKICHITSKETNNDILSIVKSILVRQPFTDAEYYQVPAGELQQDYDILLTNDFLMNKLKGFQPQTCLTEQGFILYIANDRMESSKFDIIFECATESCYIYLLRPYNNSTKQTVYLKVSTSDFGWVDNVKHSLKSGKNEIIHLYSEGEKNSGVVGLIKCLCTEEPNCRSTMVEDSDTRFNINEELYKKQILKNLTINVLKSGKWGTFVHFPLEFEETKTLPDAAVVIDKIGDLSSLNWVQSPTNYNR